VSAPSTVINYDQFPFRVDQYLGSRTQLFYSGLLENDYTASPFQSAGDAHYPGFPNISPVTNSHGAFGVTEIVSNTAVNDFRAGFARTVSASENLPYLNPLDYGINFVRPQNAIGGLGLPDITITAMSGGGIGNQVQGPSTSAITEYSLSDVFSKEWGRHHLKMGAEYRWGLEVPNNGFFINGNFVFNGSLTGDAFADFLTGQASQFTYGAGRTEMYMANKNVGAFVQDDFKLTKNLTLNLGLRYDYYSPQIDKDGQASTFLVQNLGNQTPGSGAGFVAIAGTNGLPKNGTYFPDYKDFQPRLGLAWDVFGNGKLAVRAGAGLFYQQLKNNLTLQQILAYPFHTQPIIQNASLDNPIQPVTGNPTIGQLYVTDPHIKTPYTEAYNFSVQYQLLPNTVLEAAYVGNESHSLLQFFELNQPYFIPGTNANGTPISTEGNKDSRRPFQGFSSILDSNSYGRSNYNSMQVSVNRRFSHNLSFLVGWTYAHSLDLSSIFHKGATNRTYLPTAQNSYDLGAEYGPSSFDVRHRLVINQIYDLPFGAHQKWGFKNSLLNGIISSWTVTTIWTAQGGYPFTIYEGNDPCQTSGGYTPSCRPNVVGDPNQGPKTPQKWFNTAAFVMTAPGQFGNAGRNIVRGPGLFDTDFSVIRHRLVPLPERFDIEFRAEIFNVFNHTNFGTPVTDLSSGSFGTITSTAVNPRELQLGLKFRF
jgi:TonB dependent receptor